jgi:hypothetical protein
MRYYIVDCELGIEKFRFMVKAQSKAAARKWVTDKVTEASVASQDDLVNWLRSGMSIEETEAEMTAEAAQAEGE